MMSTISEAAVALGRLLELSILGKATVILVIGLAIVMLSRRARASLRHLLLAATLAAVLALPLIVLSVPEVTIGVPASQASESADLIPTAPPVALTAPTITSLPSRATERAPWSLPSWMTIFRTVWLAGVFLLLALLAIDLRRLYRIRREGLLWMESRELMQWLASECGVRRKVEVLLHEGIQGPLTCGIWRPAILLPDEACEWNEADLRRALVHELEHVRRSDWAIQLAARASCIFYWFHPLVWVALRRLSLEAERAADDAVVRSAGHTEYAEQLVLLAGRLSKVRTQPALGMANRSDLSARVSALLDDRQRRGRAGWRPTAGVLSVAFLVVLTLAPVRAVTLPRQQTTASAQTPVLRVAKPGERGASGLDRALVRAAAVGDISEIEELLRAGANVNCIVRYGEFGSPLIGAAKKGRLDAARLLLDRGADPNLAPGTVTLARMGDRTPLIKAAEQGHVEIVSLLLDRGAIIDRIAPGWPHNALILASAKGQLEVVKLLVTRGADVNAQVWASRTIQFVNAEGKTMTGKVSRGEFKRKKDGTVYIVEDTPENGEWRTPLIMAKRGGHKDVVDFLLASGARE
jgi:beta-lactamase regulating signal transducer with metallopeptidase domain/ankyrin repeat protein